VSAPDAALALRNGVQVFKPYSPRRTVRKIETWLIATVLLSQFGLFVSFLGLAPEILA
jgi:hypothetical protein